MRQRNLALLLLLVSSFSCQLKSPAPNKNTIEPRAAASVKEDGLEEDDIEEKHRKTFLNLVDESNEHIENFLNRQLGFFYIAQELIGRFDLKLNELHQKHIRNQKITADEFRLFNEMRFKNMIAWEFSERNLNELVALYRLALLNANDSTSPYANKCSEVLSKTGEWFKKAWEKGDRAAVLQLAEHFEDVNDEILASDKKVKVPSLRKYTGLSAGERQKAMEQSLEFAKKREVTVFDHFMNEKWYEFYESRKTEFSGRLFDELYDLRTPQALDTLEPSPGPNGHVTGNRFPRGAWAFTFDDGPHAVHTPGMFENLKSTKTKATFFWLTQNMLRYPDLVKKAGELGFSRASHSYTHANLPTLKPAGLNHEIFEAMDGFQKVVGSPVTLFRCPYGACGGNDSPIRKMIASRQALEIFWNVDTLDWQDKNPQTVFERAKKQVDVLGRGIILFHDVHPQSVIASKMLMQYIQSKPDLRIELLKDLIGESRGKPFESP